MKAKILIAILTLAAAQAQAATTDSLCLTIGSYAKTVAEKRESGMKEAEIIALVQNPNVKEAITAVVRYVYTMELDPTSARKLVYLKCLGGEFRP